MKKIKLFILSALFILFNTQLYSQSSDVSHTLYGMWAKRAAFGSNGNATITSSAMDDSGNVFLSGIFSGTLNFSDDICNPVTSYAGDSGKKGEFLIKFNSLGEYQWHIVYTVTQGTLDPAVNADHASQVLDYQNGQILFYGKFVFKQVGGTMKIKASLYNKTGLISETPYEKQNDVTEITSASFFQFLNVINSNNGQNISFVSPFASNTQNVSARLIGNEIHAIHFGFGGATYFDKAQSVVSVYNATTGAQIGTNFAYPNQPRYSPSYDDSGSTIICEVTQSDGSHVLLHHSFDQTPGNKNVKAVYLLKYNADYTQQLFSERLAMRAIGAYQPKLSMDASDNVYLAINYGDANFWDNGQRIPDSDTINNLLGTGKNFVTNTGRNKVILTKLTPDLQVDWMFQLGSYGNLENGKNDNVVNVKSMKTVGDYTYIVGVFQSQNVDFGNGVQISDINWSMDGFFAVYRNSTGKCLYATNIGNNGYEETQTVSISPDNKIVLIGGIYKEELIFQPDPSGRLYPLSGDNSSNEVGFAALYSTESSSKPVPYPSSFGDAPSIYGTAVHHVYECIKLGGINMSTLQEAPVPSDNADSDANDDAFGVTGIPYSNGYVNLSSSVFKLNPNGDLVATVKVYNRTQDAAKVIGWIDFNQNGVFDGNEEASSLATVNSGTTAANATTTLTWPKANGKMRAGKTYLRLRITTDKIDGNQPVGLFFNGEVEDYRIDFNPSEVLQVSKTGTSNNTIVGNTTADEGDIITYEIQVKNNTVGPLNLVLFDPIPDGTEYVSSTLSGSLKNDFVYNHQTISAVIWPSSSFAAGTSKTYSYQAKVNRKPASSDFIRNIAYYVVNSNGDTIPTNAVEIAVNKIRAYDDNAVVCEDGSVIIDVLQNDYHLTNCNVIPIVTNPPSSGTAETEGNTIKYTPNPGYTGGDTFKYSITCEGTTVDATVYVAVNPLPIPTISGEGDVCLNDVEDYTTESGMKTYTWVVTGGTVINGAGTNSISVSWTGSNGKIELTIVNNNNCQTSITKDVNIHPIPQPDIIGPNVVCKNDVKEYRANLTDMGTYIWSVTGGEFVGPNDGPTVEIRWNGTDEGAINLTLISIQGCSSINGKKMSVKINELPDPSFDGLYVVCYNDEKTYKARDLTLNSYIWTVNGGEIIAGKNTHTITVRWENTAGGTISLAVANSNTCKAISTEQPVAINALPANPTLTGPFTVCYNQEAVYTSTGDPAAMYSWTIEGGTPIGATDQPAVTVRWDTGGPGSVKLAIKNANGCASASPAQEEITINALPANPAFDGPLTVCYNQEAVYTSTGAPATKYSWTIEGGTPVGATDQPAVTVRWDTGGPGSVKLAIKNANGCASASPTEQPVTINDLPADPTFDGPLTVCYNQEAIYTSTGDPAAKYSWTIEGGTPIGATDQSSVKVLWNGTDSGSVKLAIENANGCASASPAEQPVTINELPADPTISGPAVVCYNQDAIYTSTGDPATKYTWTIEGGTPVGATDQASVTVRWDTSGPGSVKLAIENANGCASASPAEQPVTINELPADPTISGPAVVCYNQEAIYTSTGDLAAKYSWTIEGGTPIGVTDQSSVKVLWNGTDSGSVKLAVENANGCASANPAEQPVTINDLPADPTFDGPLTVCYNQEAVYTSTGAPATKYSWTIEGGTPISTTDQSSVKVLWNGTDSGSVKLAIENANGCASANPAEQPVIINDLPANPTISGPAVVCYNQEAIYTSTGDPAAKYSWTIEGGTPVGATDQASVTVRWDTSGPGSVKLAVENANGCASASPTEKPVTINELPVPMISGIEEVCRNEEVIYSTQDGHKKYNWTVTGGTIIEGDGTHEIKIRWTDITGGTIRLSVTNQNNCTSETLATKTVVVNELPAPTISGPTPVWNNTTIDYSTEAGKNNYYWVVTGGIIQSGQGSSSIKILWGSGPTGTIKVTYANDRNCSGTSSDFNVSIQNAVFGFSATSTDIIEGGAAERITICLGDETYAPSGGILINLTSTAASKAEDADYNLSGGSISSTKLPAAITIPGGERCISFDIDAILDDWIEGPESLVIKATSSDFPDAEINLTIIDRTIGDIIVRNEGGDASEPTAGSKFWIGFREDVKSTKKIKVSYKLEGSAVSGEDYEGLTGYVIIRIGERGAEIDVTPKDNYIVEGTRTLELILMKIEEI